MDMQVGSRGHRAAAIVLIAASLGFLSGCRSFFSSGMKSIQVPTLSQSLEAIEAVKKRLPGSGNDERPQLPAPTKIELAQFKEAKQLTQSGEHARAEALLLDPKGQGYRRFFDFSGRRRRSLKKKWEKESRLGDTLNPQFADPGAGLREESLYLLAENQFQLKKFAASQDNFTLLLTDFPSTRYIDHATGRLFEIGRFWLDSQHFKSAGKIRPVGASTPSPGLDPSTTRGWLLSLPLVPNFTDSTRPVFDTRGRALQSLKTIWLNDPTGELADDALMLSATVHLERGDYREADRVFTSLRKLYPESPYLESAFLLGSHVRLMSYQGAGYDETPLEQSGQLKQSLLRLFPEAEEQDRLKDELAAIKNAKAAREWERVRFYRKKNLPNAMAVHLVQILAKYPGTIHAERARKLLGELGPEYASGAWLRQEVEGAGNPLSAPSAEEPGKPTADQPGE